MGACVRFIMGKATHTLKNYRSGAASVIMKETRYSGAGNIHLHSADHCNVGKPQNHQKSDVANLYALLMLSSVMILLMLL